MTWQTRIKMESTLQTYGGLEEPPTKYDFSNKDNRCSSRNMARIVVVISLACFHLDYLTFSFTKVVNTPNSAYNCYVLCRFSKYTY